MSRCPLCKAPTEKDWRPFCSKRCADIDLGRWMTGAYTVPGDPADEDDLRGGDGGDET
jgi:uncharacterized protein